jgi:ABC-type amino acid transport substrate-binding protein
LRDLRLLILGLLMAVQSAISAAPDPLTGEEIQWVREHPIVRYTGEPNWPPLEFVDDGVYSGIASGYLKLLSSTTGLRFEFVPSANWDEAMEKARRGEVDLLPCLGDTPERRKFIAFTRPYLSFPSSSSPGRTPGSSAACATSPASRSPCRADSIATSVSPRSIRIFPLSPPTAN